MNEITLIVATHERSESLHNMIWSFRSFYPNLPVIAVDSSKKSPLIKDITHIKVPFDTWASISLKRNMALDRVKTKYFILVDDDHVCTENTDIVYMNNMIIDREINIVWWWIQNIWTENYDFHGKYEIIWNTLYHFIWLDSWEYNGVKIYDSIHNFFVAETKLIKGIWWWDDNLKFAREHDDFFLNARDGLKVGYFPESYVDHVHLTKHHWWIRSKECVDYFLKKRNINNKIEIRLIDRGGNKYISYHHCMKTIDNEPSKIIKEKIQQLYWVYPLVISS